MSDPSPQAGSTLGRYLVIEQLGRGGMGLVLRGYDPKLQREVALKIVRSDAMSIDAHTRLVREARAMAKLSHPNVVAVYDVEIDRDGEVVLAMEYVQGTTLWRWLGDAPRDWRAIVAVFRAAGSGLHAAHAEGLLHRDFKPDNVLVGVDGRVRVTDFGLARRQVGSGERDDAAVSRSGSVPIEASFDITQEGQVMGTPPFMAPEQHERDELTAAADQYAYCVALWWALTKQPPFTGSDMQALVEAKRAGPPPWPTKVVVPRWIVDAIRRGLAPEPGDRWPSLQALGEALADDERRRGRIRIVLGGAVVIGIAGAFAGSWARAAPCTGARAQLADTWNDARRDAIEAAMLGTDVAFAEATWQRIAPRLHAYGERWIARHTEACEATSVRGEQSAAVLDRTMACLRRAEIDLHAALQMLEQADADVVEGAHDLVDGLFDLSLCEDPSALPDDVAPPSTAVADDVEAIRTRLAESRAQLHASRSAHARQLVEQALADARGLHYPPLQSEIMLQRGAVLVATGDYADSEQALVTALRDALQYAQWDVARMAATRLVDVTGRRLMRHGEGLAYAEVARGLVARLGDRPIDLAELLDYRGQVRRGQGKYAEAEADLREALSLYESALGGAHEDVAAIHNDLGTVHFLQARYEEAEAEHAHALGIIEAALGREHPRVVGSLANLGNVRFAQRRYEDAEVVYAKALQIVERALGPEHPTVTTLHNNLGAAYYWQRKFVDAEQHYDRALAIAQARFGHDHAETAMALLNLGLLYGGQQRLDEAQDVQRRALAILERTFGPAHPEVAAACDMLGDTYGSLGDDEQAEAAHDRALQIRTEVLGPDHPDVATSLHGRARARVGLRRRDAAMADAERALALRLAREVTPYAVAQTRFVLAQAVALSRDEHDRERARSLAMQAREAYAREPDAERATLAEIDRFVAGLTKR